MKGMMKNLMGNVMLNKRIKYFVCMLVFFALLFIGYKYFKAQSIIRDGEVLAGMVRIADQKYVYQAFMTTGKKKKIAEIDNWDVYEIDEDKSHTFLLLKSFTGEQYIVKENYQIPTAGKVNCVYVDGQRIEDKEILEAFNEILTTKYNDGTYYYISNNKEEQKRWKHFVLGYEDCPVGTDNSIDGIAKIDSKWVIVFNSDLGQKDENGYQAIYYEISPECGKIFEKSNIWKY